MNYVTKNLQVYTDYYTVTHESEYWPHSNDDTKRGPHDHYTETATLES